MGLILRRSLIFLILMIAGLMLYAIWFDIRADRYDETALPYLQDAVPELASWNYRRLEPLLSPSARQDFENERMRVAYREFNRLGELKSMDKPQFLASSSGASNILGDVEIVEYQVDLQFDSGPATAKVKLLSAGGTYYLHHFGVYSPVFAEASE